MNLLVLQCEDWTKEASQFLLQIGRKAAECKTSQDAVKLVQELDSFRNKGAAEQNDRLSTMQQIIVELYGTFVTVNLHRTKANAKANFFFDLYRCSV